MSLTMSMPSPADHIAHLTLVAEGSRDPVVEMVGAQATELADLWEVDCGTAAVVGLPQR